MHRRTIEDFGINISRSGSNGNTKISFHDDSVNTRMYYNNATFVLTPKQVATI